MVGQRHLRLPPLCSGRRSLSSLELRLRAGRLRWAAGRDRPRNRDRAVADGGSMTLDEERRANASGRSGSMTWLIHRNRRPQPVRASSPGGFGLRGSRTTGSWRSSRTGPARPIPVLADGELSCCMAAIRGLESLTRPCDVHVHTDSEYLRKGVTQWLAVWKRNGWNTREKKPVKNADLWQRLDSVSRGHQVQWFWVKGHAGHPENERADELAGQGAAGAMQAVDARPDVQAVAPAP